MIGVAGVLQRFGNARRRHVERRVDAGIEGLDCRAVTGPHLADDGEGRREEIPYSGAFTKKFGIETEPGRCRSTARQWPPVWGPPVPRWRSEERRVGKEWASTVRSRGSPYH